MNYYKRHLGDYAKKAGKLSMLEHGAYTLLIDACYDRECFPTQNEAIEWCWARTDEERLAVNFVLERFFTYVDGKYIQTRIKEEIEAYHETCALNAKIATEREKKRTERVRTVNGDNTNCHLTTNHKPRTKNQEPIKTPLPPRGKMFGFDIFWKAYPHKVSKGQAEKAWATISPTEQLQSQILVAIELAKTSEKWTKDGGRYIPHPATWLRAKGWEDEHKPNLNGGQSAGTKPDPYAELYE